MEVLFVVLLLGVGAWFFLRGGSSSDESVVSSSAKVLPGGNEFSTTPGKWDDWNVSFDKEENKWVNHHSFKGDYNEILIPTGIYLTREHIEVFIKGIEIFEGKELGLDDSEEESPDYKKWTNFLKKHDLFKDWFFDGNAWSEMVHIHDFFWSMQNSVPSEYNYLDSSHGIDKQIDLFIAYAQKGTDEVESDIRYLTSDLEVLLYDDPNQRQYRDYTEESEEYVEGEDDPFVTDVQFSRETIELLMKLYIETYSEVNPTIDYWQFNREKYFVHWLRKVKKISDFDELWFPEEDKVIGKYYSSYDYDTNESKELNHAGLYIFYGGKQVDSLWTDLWANFSEGELSYSSMLTTYLAEQDWDKVGEMKINESFDEFIEEYVGEDCSLDDNLFYVSKPSNAPVKASTITI